MPTGHKPPIKPLTAKIIHEGTIFLKNWANIFYVLLGSSGPVASADVLALATAAHNAYGTNLQNWKSNQSTLNTTRVVYVPAAGEEIVEEHTANVAGGTTSSPTPPNCAAVLSWAIDAYYRGGHPRTYLDGTYDATITGGTQFTSSFISALEGDALAYALAINDFTSGTITSCVLGTESFQSGNAWRSVVLFRPYLSATVHPRVDSQRRRLGKEVV